MHPVPFPEASGVLPCTPRRDPPAPAERTGVVRDASLDRRDAFVERVEDRILRPLSGQPREEPLDGVRPGRRGRGEAERPVGPALRPRADLCDETVSRMTCTGVPGAIPSATGSGKARNSCERCRSTVRPTTLPVATSRAASRQVVRPCPGMARRHGQGFPRPPRGRRHGRAGRCRGRRHRGTP